MSVLVHIASFKNTSQSDIRTITKATRRINRTAERKAAGETVRRIFAQRDYR